MSHIVFDRERKFKQLERSAKKFSHSDFLHRESAQRLAEHFNGVIKKKFDIALNMGCRDGYLSNLLTQNDSFKMLLEAENSNSFIRSSISPFPKIIADEEFLPFKNESFDLVVSNLSLQWVNDLPGSLIQIKRILRNGGFFIANIMGGKTLQELRYCLMQAEMNDGDKSFSPRISPFVDIRDGAGLLQRAGFAEPVAVSEEIVIKYDSIFELMNDLRNTGESNALVKMNKKIPSKYLFPKAETLYKENFSDENKNLNATAEIITISGWKKN